MKRITSNRCCDSIRMTSAPITPSHAVHWGAARIQPKSATRIPSSGSEDMVFSLKPRVDECSRCLFYKLTGCSRLFRLSATALFSHCSGRVVHHRFVYYALPNEEQESGPAKELLIA